MGDELENLEELAALNAVGALDGKDYNNLQDSCPERALSWRQKWPALTMWPPSSLPPFQISTRLRRS